LAGEASTLLAFQSIQRSVVLVRAEILPTGVVMSRRRRFSQKPMPALATDLGPEDGIDPRTLPRHPGRVSNRKALQLCRQVEHALGLFLGDCGDVVLRDLLVQSVVPAPDSSRLLVTLSYSGPEAVELSDVLTRLQGAHGLLRSEVAAAIHRRKTPDLTFRVVRQ
jgi:ribosome-binding factor A